jgi:hypothetical protein
MADDFGIAHFAALRAAPGDAITELSLACRDATGRNQVYSIDLTSPDTFRPATPVPPEQWPAGSFRPALDHPDEYSQEQLLAMGYGLRPDRLRRPDAYARWLISVSRPFHQVMQQPRPVQRKHRAPHYSNGSYTSANWGGSILQAHGYWKNYLFWHYTENFDQSYMFFTVPTGYPSYHGIWGGENTASFWGGLGGYYDDLNSLLQDGVQIYENQSGSAEVYFAWIEWFSGSGDPNPGYLTALDVDDNMGPNHNVEVIAWVCDASGHVNFSGGYGCFEVIDYTVSNYVYCLYPSTGSCHSLRQYGTFYGHSVEAIAELDGPFLTQYSPTEMYYYGIDTSNSTYDNGNDSYYRNTITLEDRKSNVLETATIDNNVSYGTIMTWKYGGVGPF